MLVLYGRSAEESPAFRALQAFRHKRGGASTIDVLIFDNSPASHSVPEHFDGRYVAYPLNPGLARPYNEALQQAEDRNIPWLMLLDQDTSVSDEYLDEVLRLVTTAPAEPSGQPCALVPKLFAQDHLLSPHVVPYWPVAKPLVTSVEGIATRRLHYFNSGAVLRVTVLRQIGGFPEEFWLDYLDHAVFFELQQQGRPIRILRSSLQHQLSTISPEREDDPAWVQRQTNTLLAAVRYYQRFESGHRLLQHRSRLIADALGCMVRGRPSKAKRLWAAALYSAKGKRDG